jgi:hypothetical protein
MINHEHRYIFIHIIKTGGSSIEKTFRGRRVHKFAKKYKKQIGSKEWNNYFKFTFVRNPWDKMVSQYFYIQKCRGGNYDLTFREFILAFEYCTESEYILGNGIAVKFNPIQLPWILDDDGNCLVDYIGRFETLQEDFNIVCDKIGVPRQQLPHENKTKHKHYTEYYDDETRSIVARKFAGDLKRFGYKFGE